jgi:hypothetical protein
MKAKEKKDNKEKCSYFGPNLHPSRAPKLIGPRLAYSVQTKVNLQVRRGPVNIGFTGPGRALDGPGFKITLFL